MVGDPLNQINEEAFGRPDEANLVDSLRREGVILASVVAELEKRIVGHILFSRMSIETDGSSIPAVALAPMAVALPRDPVGIAVLDPRKVLLDPVTKELSIVTPEIEPIAVLSVPVLLFCSAAFPLAVLPMPVVFEKSAS